MCSMNCSVVVAQGVRLSSEITLVLSVRDGCDAMTVALAVNRKRSSVLPFERRAVMRPLAVVGPSAPITPSTTLG